MTFENNNGDSPRARSKRAREFAPDEVLRLAIPVAIDETRNGASFALDMRRTTPKQTCAICSSSFSSTRHLIFRATRQGRPSKMATFIPYRGHVRSLKAPISQNSSRARSHATA